MKKFLSLVALLLCFSMSMRAQSGSCGANLTWELSDSTLTIRGYGAMWELTYPAWNDYKSQIAHVSLPEELTSISSAAFANCAITKVVIPNSVTTMGISAFQYCTNLTSVTLSKNLKTIPSDAFYGCANLTSITIPEGVTTIEYGAFAYCKLVNLSLPNSLLTIADGAEYFNAGVFENNPLTTVVIPKGVTRIGAYAFENCSALSQITLPEELTSIGACAFLGCSNLRSITIPEGVTTIEGNAFYSCDLLELLLPKSLLSIDDSGCLPSGKWSIEGGAFGSNKSLTKVTILGEETAIGAYAFCGCSALSEVIFPKKLASIGAAAFMNCTSLTSILLPEGLTRIESATFYNCNLKNVSLPQSLNCIADGEVTCSSTTGDYHGAFEKNKSLTQIIIPKGVTRIGRETFCDCSSLSQVTLSEGLTAIEENAFYNCSSLKTIQLPKTVTSVNSAFSHSGLLEIEIPEGVAVLDHTFWECKKLSKVILPSSLTTIDEWSFYNCTSLTTMTLPQSVRLIGGSAFYGCTSLSQINLPQAITTIESSAFTYCSSLREITIPDKVTAIDRYVFQGCTSLTSVTLSNNITTIGDRAFENCSSLTSITLPSELTFIEYTAFQNCKSLYSITIPSKVTQLGASIFYGCTSLASINMLPAIPPTINEQYGHAFTGVPSTAVIKVPCRNMDAYLTDSIWNATVTLPIQELPANIVTVASNSNRMGEAVVLIPNTCTNDEATIQALPREGCVFAAWNDGNTDNPRVVTVTEDVTYTATFEAMQTYQLAVNYDSKQGYVSGVGEYYPGEEATLTATPLGGYRFSKWGDGNTDNPRTIVMDKDITLEAIFITGDYCGDNILYTVKNDTLALNGSGDMWNLSEFGWKIYADEVMILQLSNGITSLGTNAFMDLMFVSKVTIPATVKTIHKRAFENCRSLTDVTFATYSQLKTIDHWAFYECINLQSIHIPEGVTTIGNGAFYGCAYLDSLTLPSTLESIADNGFAQCAKLRAMTVNAVEPPVVDPKTFENVDRSIPVYVPAESVAKYKASEVWKEFYIRSNVPAAIENVECATSNVQKILRNGQLIIIRDGIEYNAMGQGL